MSYKHGYSQKIAEILRTSTSSSLGVALGRLCLARGYSVVEVSEVLGVSRQTIYNWFTGVTEPGKRRHEKLQSLISKLQQQPHSTNE